MASGKCILCGLVVREGVNGFRFAIGGPENVKYLHPACVKELERQVELMIGTGGSDGSTAEVNDIEKAQE